MEDFFQNTLVQMLFFFISNLKIQQCILIIYNTNKIKKLNIPPWHLTQSADKSYNDYLHMAQAQPNRDVQRTSHDEFCENSYKMAVATSIFV